MWDKYTHNPKVKASNVTQRRVERAALRLKVVIDEIDVHIDNLLRWGVITDAEHTSLLKRLNATNRAAKDLNHEILIAVEGD